MVHSAGMAVRGAETVAIGPQWWLYSRHAAHAALAVTVMLMASHLDLRRMPEHHPALNPVWWALGLALALAVITLVPGVGEEINGARRWLKVGPVLFQPSELVKWMILPALACWCVRPGLNRFWTGLAPALAMVAVACGVIVLEDLGTAALIGLASMVVLLAGGAKIWQLALLAPVGLAAGIGAILQSPYRVTRLVAFMDPWADAEGAGYHPIHAMVALAEGGLTGRGLGNGIQKFGYLPEDMSDFLFAIICEELGVFGAMTVMGLYLLIIGAGVVAARRSASPFLSLLALGVVTTLGIQAIMNIAVVTVLVPTKGIALPLLSAGGTGWVMTAFALGLVAAVDRATMIESEPILGELAPAG